MIMMIIDEFFISTKTFSRHYTPRFVLMGHVFTFLLRRVEDSTNTELLPINLSSQLFSISIPRKYG